MLLRLHLDVCFHFAGARMKHVIIIILGIILLSIVVSWFLILSCFISGFGFLVSGFGFRMFRLCDIGGLVWKEGW